MKRTLIDNQDYVINSVLYIHQNPIHHKYCNRLEEWKYTSYNAFLSDKSTFLKRNEVVEWFDDKENFIFMHTILKNLDYE